MFISGAMVEVSDKIDKGEVVWVPAIIIKEIVDDEDEDEEEKEEEEEEEEEDEKKYFVKVCVNPSSFEGIKKRPNKEVDMRSIRPRPPPFSAEELKLVDYIEVFHGTSWRQGRVIGRVFRGRCKVLLEATNKLLSFKISDIRPSKVWEDGVWKVLYTLFQSVLNLLSVTNLPLQDFYINDTAVSALQLQQTSSSSVFIFIFFFYQCIMLQPRESPSTQGSVDEMSDSSSTFSPASNSPRENVKLILHILHHLLYLLSSYFDF